MVMAGSRLQRTLRVGVLMLVWVAAMWLLAFSDGGAQTCHAGGQDPPLACEYGIEPRDTGSLTNIYSAAFLHFGYGHLTSNTLPLLVMGTLAALRGIPRFLAVCFVIITVSGMGVWLFSGSGSVTAGASGVVFGLFGYLLVRGFVERDALDITVGITVLLVYNSILVGVLPTQQGVSWIGHLFGLLGGVLAAFWLRRSPGPERSARASRPWRGPFGARGPRGLSGPPPGHPG